MRGATGACCSTGAEAYCVERRWPARATSQSEEPERRAEPEPRCSCRMPINAYVKVGGRQKDVDVDIDAPRVLRSMADAVWSNDACEKRKLDGGNPLLAACSEAGR